MPEHPTTSSKASYPKLEYPNPIYPDPDENISISRTSILVDAEYLTVPVPAFIIDRLAQLFSTVSTASFIKTILFSLVVLMPSFIKIYLEGHNAIKEIEMLLVDPYVLGMGILLAGILLVVLYPYIDHKAQQFVRFGRRKLNFSARAKVRFAYEGIRHTISTTSAMSPIRPQTDVWATVHTLFKELSDDRYIELNNLISGFGIDCGQLAFTNRNRHSNRADNVHSRTIYSKACLKPISQLLPARRVCTPCHSYMPDFYFFVWLNRQPSLGLAIREYIQYLQRWGIYYREQRRYLTNDLRAKDLVLQEACDFFELAKSRPLAPSGIRLWTLLDNMMGYHLDRLLADLVQHAATSEATVPNDRRDSWWRNSIKRVSWKYRHGYRFTGSIDDPVVGSDEIDGIFKKLNDALSQFHEKITQSELAFHVKINTELHHSDLKIPVDRCALILLNQGRSTRFVVSSLFPKKGPDRASVDLRLAPLADHGDPAEWNAAFHHEWVGHDFRKARFTPLRELLKETTKVGQIGRERFFLVNHDGIDISRREVVLHKGEADALRSLASEILKSDATFVFCGASYKNFDMQEIEPTPFGEARFNFGCFKSWILDENRTVLLPASAGQNPNHDEI